MATITARKRKKGTTYTAQIRIKRGGATVYQESETFDKRTLAAAWAADREAQLRRPGELERVQHRGVTVGQVLTWYEADYDGLSKFGRSKLSTVKFLSAHPMLANLDAIALTSRDLIEYARYRREVDGAGAATVNTDFVWLGTAWRSVRISRNLPLVQEVVEDAAFSCRKSGLIGKAEERNRRPTLAELEQLFECFRVQRRAIIPMTDIVLFAVFSARRQEEISRIRWDDLDEERGRVLVRDMKHPRKLVDTWCFLPARAMGIIRRQPRVDERIFPYESKSISAAFTRACKLTGVKDLRFHDLRHEGASHLFELGLDIPRVSSITGHKSWSGLQRYTHLHEQGVVDKYAPWVGKWVDLNE